jgi:hypothetical protein
METERILGSCGLIGPGEVASILVRLPFGISSSDCQIEPWFAPHAIERGPLPEAGSVRLLLLSGALNLIRLWAELR